MPRKMELIQTDCKEDGLEINPKLQDTFNKIYTTNLWGTGSGVGSSPENVIPYVQFLATLIERYKIKSVLDLGCGDWHFSRLLNWDGIQYLGVDVASSVIEKNRKEYQKGNIQFMCGEVSDVPNLGTYDMVIMKDVLQHLSYATIFKILDFVKKNKYLLITNDIAWNKDIKDGEGWPRNMAEEPFNLVPTHQIKYFVTPRFKVSQFISQVSSAQPSGDTLPPTSP